MITLFQKSWARILLVIFLALVISGFVSLIFLYFHHQASNPVHDFRKTSLKRYPKPSHEIRGFRFENYCDGKRAISIKADRVRIQKKKVGFFRFGLLSEARFDNALIHIYGSKQHPENKSDIQDLTFNGISLKDAFPSFREKKISSIVMKPVCIKLHDEKSVVTQISAAWAAVRLKRRDILFKGNVKVVSGNNVLRTNRLSLNTETAVIKAAQRFKLKTLEKEWEGDRLTTNIFLDIY